MQSCIAYVSLSHIEWVPRDSDIFVHNILSLAHMWAHNSSENLAMVIGGTEQLTLILNLHCVCPVALCYDFCSKNTIIMSNESIYTTSAGQLPVHSDLPKLDSIKFCRTLGALWSIYKDHTALTGKGTSNNVVSTVGVCLLQNQWASYKNIFVFLC